MYNYRNRDRKYILDLNEMSVLEMGKTSLHITVVKMGILNSSNKGRSNFELFKEAKSYIGMIG